MGVKLKGWTVLFRVRSTLTRLQTPWVKSAVSLSLSLSFTTSTSPQCAPPSWSQIIHNYSLVSVTLFIPRLYATLLFFIIIFLGTAGVGILSSEDLSLALDVCATAPRKTNNNFSPPSLLGVWRAIVLRVYLSLLLLSSSSRLLLFTFIISCRFRVTVRCFQASSSDFNKIWLKPLFLN